MNIYRTIKSEAHHALNRPAVTMGDMTLSYGGLFKKVESTAYLLKDNGIGPQAKVALLCADSIEYIIMSLAILSLEAVIVPISPQLSWDETENVLDKIHIDHLIYDQKSQPQNHSVIGESVPLFLPEMEKHSFKLIFFQPSVHPSSEFQQMEPAFIRFSSGTTGTSKGVVLSHKSIIERTTAANKALAITADDTILWVLSMSYHFVVTILLFLRKGAHIILCQDPFPEKYFEALHKHLPTFLYASPFHYQTLVAAKHLDPLVLKNVRLAITTAMKQSPQGLTDFFTKFKIKLTEAYGIIEVGLPFTNNALPGEKIGSVGQILPDYYVQFKNPDAQGIGEILIKGPGMFDAYYSPWQNKNEVCPDGWFHTGDLGRIDADGYLFILGREKNLINFAGMKIFPDEVETVLNQHPDIKESLVFGVNHPFFGELPHAKCVLHKPTAAIPTQIQLRQFCYSLLPRHKVPKEFQFVDAIDKTASGKIKRW